MIQNKEKTNEYELAKSRIEREVLARKKVRAHARIVSFLKQFSGYPQNKLDACEWYRRLGMYQEGLKLLKIERGFQRGVISDAFENKRLIWAARFLNAMGANDFALGIAKKITPVDPTDFRILGGIFVSNYRYGEAAMAFQSLFQTDNDLNSYSSRLAKISYADALNGLGKHQKAFNQVKEVYLSSQEFLLRGICLQAAAEYLIALELYPDALRYLEKAQKLMPSSEETVDLGFLLKWKGFCYGQLGKRSLALRSFSEAEHLLCKPELRPEVGFEIMRLKQELGYLSLREQEQLYFYPGLSTGLTAQLKKINIAEFGDSKAKLSIDFTRDEYCFRSQYYLKIPKELKLLGHLVIAGERGLSKTRAKTLLWPEEFYSYGHMDARLNQLIARLRKVYEIAISSEDSVMKIRGSFCQGVQAWVGDACKPSFLEKHSQFTTLEFAKYYAMKKTNAVKALKAWQKEGFVKRVNTGKNSFYSSEILK